MTKYTIMLNMTIYHKIVSNLPGKILTKIQIFKE